MNIPCKNAAPFLFLLAFLPASASAQVVISEIMYDAAGADTGHEWIEVFNGTGSSLPLTDWRLLEANTNHKMTAVQGSDAVAPGTYAVVADNAPIFLADHPGYAGLLFDSAFSLSNDGETLVLRDASLTDADSVAYLPAWGAGGDGQSLTRLAADGAAFAAASPTPGTGTLIASTTISIAPADASGTSDTGSSADQTDNTPADASASKPVTSSALILPAEPQIYAYAGLDRTVITGADVELDGEAFSKAGDPIENVRFLWNFGDGATKEGAAVLHHWSHPGRYAVVLNIAEDKYAAMHSIIVTAAPAQLALSTLPDGSIAIANDDSRTLDLSGWHISMNGASFDLPEHTLILAGASVPFTPEVTGFRGVVHPVTLLYPNGEVAVREGGITSSSALSAAATPRIPLIAQGVSVAAVSARSVPPTAKAATSAKASGGASLIGMRIGEAAEAAGGSSEPSGGAVEPEASDTALQAKGSELAAAALAAPSAGLSPWTWGAGALVLLAAALAVVLRRRSRLSWAIVEDTSDAV